MTEQQRREEAARAGSLRAPWYTNHLLLGARLAMTISSEDDRYSTFPPVMLQGVGHRTLKVTGGTFKLSTTKREYFQVEFADAPYATIMPAMLPLIRWRLEELGIVCEGRDPKEVLMELIGKEVPVFLSYKHSIGPTYYTSQIFPTGRETS